MKQAFWLLCACILPVLIGGSLVSVSAQTPSATPDPFVAQITSNPSTLFTTAIGDMSANGRFVVFVSNGDLSTEKARDHRNNADGNREIFLFDYAQRRIFQITDTKHVPNPAASPSPTPTPTPTPSPTPSPSPTPTPTPTPADLTQVRIEIDNRSPMISLQPQLVGGVRSYIIVFSSNAPDPKHFDGTFSDALGNDANSEIWIYRVPAVADVDLTLGTDIPIADDLATGTFFKVRETPASRKPTAGSASVAPFFADDNREPTISDDGRFLAFISTRDLVPGVGNADGNPELFLYNIASDTLTQATKTQDPTPGVGFIFQSNPNLSADGSVVSFISSANLATNNADTNAEIFVASFNGSTVSNVRQVTRTLNGSGNTNVFSAGRRMSRDGAFIAFESRATDPKSGAAPTSVQLGMFVYNVSADTFVEVGPRATTFTDITRFPTFTDYNSSLAPSSLVFASALNFRTDGTFPPVAEDATGLNPQRASQVFLTQVPASSSNTFTRMTNTPALSTFGGTRPVTSETRKRMSFVLGGVEMGGGNADFSLELYYLLSPQVTTTSSAVLSFFTGFSSMPVATATPVPSPSPSPTPTPSPVPGSPLGLAAGEVSIVRSTVPLASSTVGPVPGSEVDRSPALPIELNGVSVAVNGAAAGLYFVGNAEQQIDFVVPIGFTQGGLGNVVINKFDPGTSTNTVFRGFVQIVAAQPDIFTDTRGPGGRAGAANVTDPNTRTGEPFSVTSTDATGATVPTVIELTVTGMRNVQKAETTVTVGTTAITGDSIVAIQPNPNMPGFDIVLFKLPASLAGAGDVPVVITVQHNGVTTSSRPADTAPHITIN